ncbi:hypothetical protein Sj15T_38940 [Sphingobium sp. TA15]|nr:hypothetical protein Sj15T_38940 [Sphingobium sp. TA15]
MVLIVDRISQGVDRSISKRALESQLGEQTMRHNNLLVAGIGKAKGRVAPGRVRDREAAALAGGGGADLRSKLGGPPILDAAWCVPHARKTLTGGFNKSTPARRADRYLGASLARTMALYSSSACRTFSSSVTVRAWLVADA